MAQSLTATPDATSLPVWRTALCLTAFQIFILLMVTGGGAERLMHWDAKWYLDIAVDGYSVSYPLKHDFKGGDNIAFFPAFPLWLRVFIQGLDIRPNIAALIAAQTACVGIWAYFLAILRRWKIQDLRVVVLGAVLMVQPGSFYNVVGYSESLFSASMLGFIYWTHRAFDPQERRFAFVILMAIVHGAILSSTRVVGVALCGYPVILFIVNAALDRSRKTLREALKAGFLSLLSLSGFFAFLIYCEVRWGSWDLYWQANRVGWKVFFDPGWMLRWDYYVHILEGNLSEVLGRLFTIGTVVVHVLLMKEMGRRREAQGLALSFLCLGFLIQTIVGSHGMHSMVRYLIPIDCLLLLIAALYPLKKPLTLRQGLGTAAVGLFLFALQIMFAIRYSRNDWVS